MKRSLLIICITFLLCGAMFFGYTAGLLDEIIAYISVSENNSVNNSTIPDDLQNDDEKQGSTDDTEEENSYIASAPLLNSNILYGSLVEEVVLESDIGISATIPASVRITAGATSLNLSVVSVDADSALVLDEGDSATSLDVHIDGISKYNSVPMIINLGTILDPGIHETNLKFYHTEDGVAVQMTRVDSVDDFAIHNQYTYDVETGEVSIYIASFSVISGVTTTNDAWDGTSATDFEGGEGTEADPYIIATAEQLAYFRDQVDGGNTFKGKYIKLTTDVDLELYKVDENGALILDEEGDKIRVSFDPIGQGYWNESKVDPEGGVDSNTVFMGTFDGGNHTIYNLYQNGWDLGYSYSTAGGGLFASIKDSTIKNIAVSGAQIVMECIDMGTVVGYAQGTCHFENIVVTKSKLANYQRYTGAVVGEVSYGPYGTDISLGYSHTFKNITVDSSVKVSSLWGDFDNSCGGVIGGKWGNATVKMENITVACEIDAFSDVTAAYQWYAYRRCGMLIGHTEQNSPRKATSAHAGFLTCENVRVYYGDWVNYTYYEYENQDSDTGKRYPWVRAEAGEHNNAFSNPRYGVPTHDGVKVTGLDKSTDHTTITFNQLYGGGQGVYGCATHEGVTIMAKQTVTIYVENQGNWDDLRIYYWFVNGEDIWDNMIQPGEPLTQLEGNVYTFDLPAYADGFVISGAGANQVIGKHFLKDVEDGEIYYTTATSSNNCPFCGNCADYSCTDPDCTAKCTGCSGIIINGIASDTSTNIIFKNVAAPNLTDNTFIVYTYDYLKAGGTMLTDTEGLAFVVDEYGKLVRVYDGANNKYFDKNNNNAGVEGICINGEYLTPASASLNEGEYILVAPYVEGTDCHARYYLLTKRQMIGSDVYITNFATVIDSDGEHVFEAENLGFEKLTPSQGFTSVRIEKPNTTTPVTSAGQSLGACGGGSSTFSITLSDKATIQLYARMAYSTGGNAADFLSITFNNTVLVASGEMPSGTDSNLYYNWVNIPFGEEINLEPGTYTFTVNFKKNPNVDCFIFDVLSYGKFSVCEFCNLCTLYRCDEEGHDHKCACPDVDYKIFEKDGSLVIEAETFDNEHVITSQDQIDKDRLQAGEYGIETGNGRKCIYGFTTGTKFTHYVYSEVARKLELFIVGASTRDFDVSTKLALYVNGVATEIPSGSLTGSGDTPYWDWKCVSLGILSLNEGINEITIELLGGNPNIDKIQFISANVDVTVSESGTTKYELENIDCSRCDITPRDDFLPTVGEGNCGKGYGRIYGYKDGSIFRVYVQVNAPCTLEVRLAGFAGGDSIAALNGYTYRFGETYIVPAGDQSLGINPTMKEAVVGEVVVEEAGVYCFEFTSGHNIDLDYVSFTVVEAK